MEPVRVAVRGGQVLVLPGSGGRPAQLHVPPGVHLRVNGRAVYGTALLHPGDRVEVDLPPPLDPGGFEVEVSPDAMSAYVHLRPCRAWVLRDRPPAPVAALELELRELPPPDLTRETLRAALEEAGVRWGVQEEALAAALRAVRGRIQVACGVPPLPGADGHLEFLIPHSIQPESGGRFSVPRAEPGQVLARVHPPQPGREGRDVRGQRLPAPTGRPVEVEPGEGVRLRQGDGVLLVEAARAGRPCWIPWGERRWRAEVVPVQVVEGDLEGGALRAEGDVVIQGSVREGAEVRAGGSVWVAGYVDGARIQAGGSVHVRGGAFRSALEAGFARRLGLALQAPVERLWAELERMEEAVQALERAAAFRTLDLERFGPGRLVQLLLEMKFQEVPLLARQLGRLLPPEEEELPGWEAGLDPLRRLVKALTALPVDPRLTADRLREEAERVRVWIARLALDPGGLEVGYLHQSRARAAGSARVGRAGMYHAYLEAGGSAEVDGPVVGGRVRARDRVAVRAAGSPARAETWLEVEKEEGEIRIGRGYPRVWVWVGRTRRCLEAPVRDVRVVASGVEPAPVPNGNPSAPGGVSGSGSEGR